MWRSRHLGYSFLILDWHRRNKSNFMGSSEHVKAMVLIFCRLSSLGIFPRFRMFSERKQMPLVSFVCNLLLLSRLLPQDSTEPWRAHGRCLFDSRDNFVWHVPAPVERTHGTPEGQVWHRTPRRPHSTPILNVHGLCYHLPGAWLLLLFPTHTPA